MKRRIIAAVAALLLAAVGAVQLCAPTSSAPTSGRWPAMETVRGAGGRQAPIAEGTPADQLTELAAPRPCPRWPWLEARRPDLDQLNGSGRHHRPAARRAGDRCPVLRPSRARRDAHSAPVPEGMQEVSLHARLAAGPRRQLAPGDRVGVFFSVDERHSPGPAQRAGQPGPGRPCGGAVGPKTPTKPAPLPETA